MEHEVTRNLFANIKATGFPDKREEMSLVREAMVFNISSLICSRVSYWRVKTSIILD